MLLQSLEGAATALTKVPTSKQIQAVPPAPEEIVEKDGKVYVKTPDGKLVVAEDRASGQVTVSLLLGCAITLLLGTCTLWILCCCSLLF